MFIVLVGTRSAGKSTIQDYLVAKHGFKVVTVSTDSATDQQEGVIDSLLAIARAQLTRYFTPGQLPRSLGR
jgi:shikimate kinase